MKRQLPLIFLSLTVISFAAFTTYQSAVDNAVNTPHSTPTPAEINVTLSYNTGVYTKYYQEEIPSGTTAFGLLELASRKDNFKMTFKKYDFGTLVESIDGLANTPEKSWVYYVNGASALVGADSYILKPGDKIEWKYVKPE